MKPETFECGGLPWFPLRVDTDKPSWLHDEEKVRWLERYEQEDPARYYDSRMIAQELFDKHRVSRSADEKGWYPANPDIIPAWVLEGETGPPPAEGTPPERPYTAEEVKILRDTLRAAKNDIWQFIRLAEYNLTGKDPNFPEDEPEGKPETPSLVHRAGLEESYRVHRACELALHVPPAAPDDSVPQVAASKTGTASLGGQLFVVLAFRYATQQYTFPIGVAFSREQAEQMAREHRAYRGGKYDHRIYEFTPGKWDDDEGHRVTASPCFSEGQHSTVIIPD